MDVSTDEFTKRFSIPRTEAFRGRALGNGTRQRRRPPWLEKTAQTKNPTAFVASICWISAFVRRRSAERFDTSARTSALFMTTRSNSSLPRRRTKQSERDHRRLDRGVGQGDISPNMSPVPSSPTTTSMPSCNFVTRNRP